MKETIRRVRHTYRTETKAGKRKLVTKELTPRQAIRLFCIECMGFHNNNLITTCPAETCPLWPWRKGGSGVDQKCLVERARTEKEREKLLKNQNPYPR